jgi:hypothetical protein
MKKTISVLIVYISSCNLFAQSTAQITTQQGQVSINTQSSLLSAQPSAQELTDFFVSASSGAMNPLAAVTLVANQGENAVPGLTTLLFSNAYKCSIPQSTINQSALYSVNPVDSSVEQTKLIPNKVFVVLALQAIGTPNAVTTLLKAAGINSNPEIRGFALHALNNTFYTDTSKTQLGSSPPDTAIIRVLITSSNDSTYIGYLQKHIYEISQDGLMCWLGKDFGGPEFDAARTINGTKMAVNDFEQYWLKINEPKLKWNYSTRHFEVQNK